MILQPAAFLQAAETQIAVSVQRYAVPGFEDHERRSGHHMYRLVTVEFAYSELELELYSSLEQDHRYALA